MNQNRNQPQSLRILPFEGATNFRELGGYPAADGRRVKYGLLYRGGTTCDLVSIADRAALGSLGLKLIFDFRSTGEAKENPDYIPKGTRYVRKCAMYYQDGGEIDFSPAGMERLDRELSDHPEHESVLDIFTSFYARMPFENSGFQALFHALEQVETPILFHCTSGKDRTGVAAMLVLLALGANRETAIADYMETNRCRAEEIAVLRQQCGNLAEIDPVEWEMHLIRYGVLTRCADAALDAILERYGNWETYFLEEYGMNKNRLMHLRQMYLE